MKKDNSRDFFKSQIEWAYRWPIDGVCVVFPCIFLKTKQLETTFRVVALFYDRNNRFLIKSYNFRSQGSERK